MSRELDMKRSGAFVKLIRPINCVMVGIAVIVGAALTGKEMFANQFSNSLLGFSTGFLLTGAAMAINDFYDQKVDAVNEPNRPIPSGSISPREALLLSFVFTSLGLVIALLTGATPNLRCLAIASASWGVVILYVTKGKSSGFPGNLLVSACISVPFIYGAFAVGEELPATTSIFIAIVFLSNTGREITKGIVDVQGDEMANIKTIAMLYGRQRAALVATAFYLSAVSLTPLPWILGIVSFWFMPFVVLTNMGLILASALLLLNPSKENAKRIKNRNLLWFFTGLLAFITGTF